MEAITTILTSTLLAASVSALVSILLKDKEYRNDYYKKVIDKRITAVEAAEAITSVFMLLQGFDTPMRDCHVYYVDELDSNKLSNVIDKASAYNFWYSGETLVAVRKLTMVAFPVEAEARKLKAKGASKRELQEFASTHHEEVSEAVLAVGNSLAADMSTLYDVKRFFKSKLRGLPR
jgi:hypothetical protein